MPLGVSGLHLCCDDRLDNTNDLVAFAGVEDIGMRLGETAGIIVEIAAGSGCEFIRQGGANKNIRATPKPSFTIFVPSIEPGFTDTTAGPASPSRAARWPDHIVSASLLCE